MSSWLRRYEFKLTLSQRKFFEKNARNSRAVQRGSLDWEVAEDSMNIESLLISGSAVECSVWNPWLLDIVTRSKSVFGRVLRLFQEFGHCRSIEIEHLGPRQFAVVEVVQSEYLFVQNISFPGAPSLTP